SRLRGVPLSNPPKEAIIVTEKKVLHMSQHVVSNLITEAIESMLLKKMVFSRPLKKSEGPQRADAKLIMLKSGLHLQITRYMKDGKALFVNFSPGEATVEALKLLDEFKQINIMTTAGECQAAAKGGEIKIIFNRIRAGEESVPAQVKEHDAKKEYIIPEKPALFLIKLGIMNESGRVYDKRRAKFRQINRFLEYLRDTVDRLDHQDEICIYDLCCGKGYLTFAAYHYISEIRGLNVSVFGADLKEDVISKCSQIAKDCGYSNLHFACEDIAKIKPSRKVDIVMALHACDTATDIALAHAVKWNAGAILSAPCCQHEVASQMESRTDGGSVFKQRLLRHRFAQLLTDALRCSVLEICGYGVQAVEFIDPEETDKNLMIRAIKKKRPEKEANLEHMKEDLRAELAKYDISPSLVVMLQERLK
ncbi:MAG: class I SAM-dependent methyltransferase, partial [Christensenellales bacterium]